MHTIPNRTNFVAQILSVQHMKDGTNRLLLRIEVIDSEIQQDTRFIKAGRQYDAICFSQKDFLIEGAFIIAEGEYIGGPFSGQIAIQDYIRFMSKEEE